MSYIKRRAMSILEAFKHGEYGYEEAYNQIQILYNENPPTESPAQSEMACSHCKKVDNNNCIILHEIHELLKDFPQASISFNIWKCNDIDFAIDQCNEVNLSSVVEGDIDEYWFGLDDKNMEVVVYKVRHIDGVAHIQAFGDIGFTKYENVLKYCTLMEKIELPEHPLDYQIPDDESPSEIPTHSEWICYDCKFFHNTHGYFNHVSGDADPPDTSCGNVPDEHLAFWEGDITIAEERCYVITECSKFEKKERI